MRTGGAGTTRLAVRLTLAGGREALVRLGLTAAGLALAAAMLLAASVGFPALRAHDARRAWTQTSAANHAPAQDESGTDPLLWRVTEARFDGRDLLRVDVAALGPDAPVPPGLAALPEPGEVAVSPGLADLLGATDPAQLGDRVPGRVTATVGPDALVAPGDLVAVVGRPADVLRDEPGVTEVRSIESAPAGRALTRTMRALLALGAIGLLVPIAVFVATATRLAAARREQRLAAVRLAGATTAQVGWLAAVEALMAASAGVAGGFGLFLALRPRMARVPFDGAAFYPADLRLSAGRALGVALVVPAVAVVAALVSLRRVRVSPLGVARRAERARPSARPLLLVAAGLALLAGTSAWAAGSDAEQAETVGVGLGFLVVIVGVVWSGPWLVARVAGAVARLGRGVPSLLAGRRLQDDPAAGFRAISGIALAVFVGTVFSGVAASVLAGEVTGADGLAADAVVATLPVRPDEAGGEAERPAVEASALVAALADTDGVERVVTAHRFPDDPALRDAFHASGADDVAPVLVTCADAAALGFAACAPAGDVTVLNMDGGDVSATGFVAPPTVGDPAARPVVGVAAVTDGRTTSLERARTVLEAGFPGARAVTRADVDAEARTQFRTLERATNLGLTVTLVIAGCSLAVAAAGTIVERRQPFALLRLTGTRLSELRRTVLAETAAPLLVVAAATAGLGQAVTALVLRAGGRPGQPIALPGPGYWLSLGGGLGLALLVVTATLPLLNRLTRPDAARRG